MTSEQLVATREAIPFQPFFIHMTDGRSFRIPHRDYLMILPNGRIAFVARAEGNAADILDVMLISGLTLEATTPIASANNGSG